jgi:hypothetical protein
MKKCMGAKLFMGKIAKSFRNRKYFDLISLHSCARIKLSIPHKKRKEAERKLSSFARGNLFGKGR